MATGTCPELDELQRSYVDAGDDFGKLLIMIGRFRIDIGPETPDSVEKAKAIIAGHIESGRRTRDEKQHSLDLRSKSLSQKLRELRVNQERCGDFFDRTLKELPKLSTFMTCQLYRICQDFKEQLKTRLEKLKNGRIRILVTGEVCAGKSSVSSLLMGGAYLPVDHGPCTRIPCEITHSEERKAYLYYKEDNCMDPVVVELSYDENHPSWRRVRDCVEMGKDRESQKELEKVVLRWPLVVLASQESMVLQPFKQTDKPDSKENDSKLDAAKLYTRQQSDTHVSTYTGAQDDVTDAASGITFIDVPGIYDTDQSFHTLYPYIRSADAFLLIVNNADGPGVARDRLLKLMRIIQEFSEEDNCTFNPKFSLFVCNKWDRVDLDRRDKLLHETLNDLKKAWPSVNMRQLVPCVATREVLQAVRSRSIGNEYEMFYHKMCGFLETAIRTQIEINSWWLTSFLDRTIVIIQHADEVATFAKQKTSEVKQQIATVKLNIMAFEDARKSVEQEILNQTDTVKQKVKEEIGNCLRKNRMSLSNWKNSTIPQFREDVSWEQVHHEISTAIAGRLECHIQDDENIQSIKQEFDEFIRSRLTSLIRKYELLEREMPLIVDTTNGMWTKFDGINTAIRQRADLFPYVAAGLAVIFFPLAPFILILWRIYDEMSTPKLLCNEDDFRDDKKIYMARQTTAFIDNIVKSRLVTVTEAAVQDAPRNAKFMIAFLHNCSEKHLESANALMSEVTSKRQRGDSPGEMEKLSEELKLFVINNVIEDDIDENTLGVDIDNPMSRIGGAFLTSVHRGHLITDEQTLNVAVKVIKWPKGEGHYPDNAFIIRELLTIQMLSHKPRRERSHFIEYHGFLTETTTDQFRLKLVTDLYDYNLQNLIQTEKLVLPSHRVLPFPADDRAKGPSWYHIFHIALQAALGLQFLHRYNVVHRDIKPSNFLIRLTTDAICVHLADVGMSHKVDLVHTRGPNVGTDLYNAPEVRHGDCHSPASDIYSLCLVFWELWYGRTVYAELSDAELKRNRERKPPRFADVNPPSSMKKLIQKGWDSVPARRPHIRAFVTCLQGLCEEYMAEK